MKIIKQDAEQHVINQWIEVALSTQQDYIEMCKYMKHNFPKESHELLCSIKKNSFYEEKNLGKSMTTEKRKTKKGNFLESP